MFGKLAGWVRGAWAAPLELRLGAAVGLALLWVYWPTLVELIGRWASDAQYSHGFAVPLFAGYLLWARRGLLPGEPHPSWWGSVLLLAGLGLHFAGTYLFFDWLAAAALLPCVAGLVLLVGGGRALRWAWPAVAFLIFMVPLPHRLQVALANPLQRVGTVASTYVLQTLGFVAFSEGNVIRLGEYHIGVVEACSGLAMLMTFFALSVAVILVIGSPWYEKLVIFVSAIPIALVSNITRITVTGIAYQLVGREVGDYVFHTLFGYLMPVLALCLLWVELRLLAWVLVPRAVDEAPDLALAPTAGLPLAAKQAAPAAPAAQGKKAAPPEGQRKVLAGLGLAVSPRNEPKPSPAKEDR